MSDTKPHTGSVVERSGANHTVVALSGVRITADRLMHKTAANLCASSSNLRGPLKFFRRSHPMARQMTNGYTWEVGPTLSATGTRRVIL